MMTAQEIARETKFSQETIYRKARIGEIPCYRLGSGVRFKLEEVEMAMRGGKDAKKGNTRGRNHLAEQ